ncbi:hypothetical protein [Halobacillus litoralis]|uniref:hypothetical protein n=1 Tax=Halobacillus litoralis TaxID=45668 RepID=UPI002493B70A|nr:hypothetical protein [Halobacillus litoralis]
MLVYIIALAICAGGWYFYTYQLKSGGSTILLSLFSLGISVMFLVAGLLFSGAVGSQEATMTVAFLAILLFFNGICMLITALIQTAIRNVNEQ